MFTAKPGESYIVAQGVQTPKISFMRLSLARMAGAGTQGSPLQITNAAQLAEIAELVNVGILEKMVFNNESNTVYLILMNDLDLSGYGKNWNEGKGWVSIGRCDDDGAKVTEYPFKGVFDGNNKKITGLYIKDDTLDNAGLFGWFDGTVKNLGVVNADISGHNEVGRVVGNN